MKLVRCCALRSCRVERVRYGVFSSDSNRVVKHVTDKIVSARGYMVNPETHGALIAVLERISHGVVVQTCRPEFFRPKVRYSA